MLWDERKNLIGILPLFFFKRKVKKFFLIKSFVSSYSLRSGPLFSPELSKGQKDKALDVFMLKLLKDANYLGIDNIRISYPVIYGDNVSLEHYGYFPLKKYGFKEGNVVTIIKNLQIDEDELLKSLYQNCRNKIRQAKKKGAQFTEIDSYEEWMNCCYTLNLETFSTEAAKPFSKRYLGIIWKNFVEKGMAKVTGIKFEDRIISVRVTVFKGKSCYNWLCFNSKPSPIPGANNLLNWENLLYFKKRGMDLYEIGSLEFGDEKQIQISQFKESFNGKSYYCLDGELHLRPIKNSLLELSSHLKDYFSTRINTLK